MRTDDYDEEEEELTPSDYDDIEMDLRRRERLDQEDE